jgi:hypothetical protein
MRGADGDLARVGGGAGVGFGGAECAHAGHEIGVDVDLGLAARPAAEEGEVGLADEGLVAAGAVEVARAGIRLFDLRAALAGGEEEEADEALASRRHPRMLRVTAAAASSSVPAPRTSETAKASWANGQMPRASRAAIRFSAGWA